MWNRTAKMAPENTGMSLKNTNSVEYSELKTMDRQQSHTLPYRLLARFSSNTKTRTKTGKHDHHCFLRKSNSSFQNPSKETKISESMSSGVCFKFNFTEKKARNNKLIDRCTMKCDKLSKIDNKNSNLMQSDDDDFYYLSTPNKLLESDAKTQKVVSFKTLSIREYDLIIGDNPSCSVGLPITLGWNHTDDKIIDIDYYETNRKPRRKPSEFKLASDIRLELLCDTGINHRKQIHHIERKLYKERKPCKLDKFFAPATEIEKMKFSRVGKKN